MKIYIIGASGSGKTSYGNFLEEKYGLKHYNNDYIQYEQNEDKRGRTARNTEELSKIIESISNTDNWVYEGIQLYPSLLERSDSIVFLKISLLTSLYRQWKRFITDRKQRKEHGFFNNLKLSRFIITKQFNSKGDTNHLSMKNLEKQLKIYHNKLIITGDWRKIDI